ncbi:MAG: ABC transporter ATP-binding protein [Vicinamibacteria bacterium]
MPSECLSVSDVFKTQKTPFSRRPGFKVGPLNLRMAPGEIVGLLGANGAGKTTTLKLLMGLLVPDSGSIELVGFKSSNNAWRSQVGYLPEQPAFYEYLTGREFLHFAAELFGISSSTSRSRSASLLAKVGLAASADRRIRTYSKGMQQRLGIAQALLNEPHLLILDEPMSGLDPMGRRFVRDLMLELRSQGCSILFSTHVIPDAEFVCDRIALMRMGTLLAVGTLDELLGIPTQFEVACTRNAGAERETFPVGKDQLPEAIAKIVAQGANLVSVSPLRASVEDLLAPPKVPTV